MQSQMLRLLLLIIDCRRSSLKHYQRETKEHSL